VKMYYLWFPRSIPGSWDQHPLFGIIPAIPRFCASSSTLIIFQGWDVWERARSKLVSEVESAGHPVQWSDATAHPAQSNQVILPEQLTVS